ncbi:MAG TPA: nicotinamide riboside transporter PnuC [Blastocatellia bacterium]|nr:nicotinamide riboside transporter PnuC [Blastocatellia bacterium]
MNYYELFAVAFGLVSVLLTIKENIWCWPTGIISVSLYIIVFYRARLYGEMGLQVVFIALQIYGWYEWLRGGPGHGELHIARASPSLRAWLALIAIAGIALMGYLLATMTDASLPLLDSTVTVLSLIAQWMLAKKLLESWIIWIAVDVLSIGIYFYRELYLSTVLYATFLVLATVGFIEWRKILRSLQPA